MIERVHIENFRCLKDVTVELGPLTILVGPNACGKTALLEALDPKREILQGDHWGFDKERDVIRAVWETGDLKPQVHQDISAIDWHGPVVQQRIEARVGPHLPWRGYSAQLVRFQPDELRKPNTVSAATRIDQDGANLTNVFATLTRRRQLSVAEQLCRLIPMFRDVDSRPTADRPGRHQLRFEDRWTPDLWYTPEQVSDGTMLTLAFLVLQHQDPPVDLLCIEEPERGLHPWLLGEVLDLLRKLSTGQLGPRPVQVILATHSAELLDHARPEEVRFMTRDAASGAVSVQAADTTTPEWREAYELYQRSLGGLWLAGGLGGVPGT